MVKWIMKIKFIVKMMFSIEATQIKEAVIEIGVAFPKVLVH